MRNARLSSVVLLLLASACAGESGSGTTQDTTVPLDSPSSETVEATDADLDGDGTPVETCVPGTGCFLETCQGNADCESGWCVPHQGERVCSKLCTTECPDGWSCAPVSLAGADMAFICVSNYSHLCRPCATSADCTSVGSSETVCVDYGVQGSFCGGPCGGSFTECPFGYSCTNTKTVDGIPTQQCMANTGVCTCTATAIELSLFTPCSVETAAGTCTGTRYCSEEGLTQCDAGTPTDEVCNGVDDDCDGATDENSCDDGNDCTQDICNPTQGCENVVVSTGECSDGNPCTAADHCENGVCMGTQVLCDDNNLCTDDVCTPEGGCDNNPNAVPCDDEDPCTVVDACSNGTCTGLSLECDCHVDEDCVVFEDGNLCNGTLRCENTTLPYRCVVDPDTVIDCAENTDSICAEYQCVPATGQCEILPANEGHPCEDGDLCTDGDACTAGLCVSTGATNCNDGNVCTQDVCDSTDGCQHVAINFACIDGNACTVGDTCTNGNCKPGAPINCNDNNPCTDDSCDAEQGCVYSANNASCDDGNECTAGDQCANGLCGASDNTNCDDGDPCTTDTCDGDSGCAHSPNTNPCNDGDVCTAIDQCANGACEGSGALSCDDGNPCTDDACAHPTGCVHTPNAGACDDGNECTTIDQCTAGACVGSGVQDCNDGNVCTTDYCKPGKGCQHDGTTNPCDDGNGCTNGDTCEGATCISGPPIVCDDSNGCTKDECVPASGQCTYTPQEGQCDDGNPCSIGDACLNGKCTSSGIFDCEEGNPCTIDICDPTQGCLHTNTVGPCDDENSCTFNDQCAGGTCAGQATSCDDGNPCTVDSCIPGAGCTNAPGPGACNDGNPCTIEDICIGGNCVSSGKIQNCDDSNVCTADICDPVLGCKSIDTPGPCSDNDLCTSGDQCQAGNCVGIPSICNDDNECTEDSCHPLKGCDFAPSVDPCDDGDECTVNDTCGNTACNPGTPLNCDDGNVCTDDSCDPIDGCVNDVLTPCCGNGVVEGSETCDDGDQDESNDCDTSCEYTYTVVGSFNLGSGPNWSTNPTPVSCIEACSIVFGTGFQYACATSNTILDHQAYLDGWNDVQFCTAPAADDFKKGSGYDCGSVGCSYSAYVEDHTEGNPGSVCSKVNWCWKRK